MLASFLCLAVAIHDVDGPIRCHSGERIRLQGIGALEMNGRARPNQPSVPGDPREQRRRMATAIGAKVVREDRAENGSAWFARPVPFRCERTGKSHKRVTAWCRLPDGRDISCVAIHAGVALRWARYDRGKRLVRCGSRSRRLHRLSPADHGSSRDS